MNLKLSAVDEDDSPLSDIDVVTDDGYITKPSSLKAMPGVIHSSSRRAPAPSGSISGAATRTSSKRFEEPSVPAELASEEDEADFTDGDDEEKPQKARKAPFRPSKSASKQSAKSKQRRSTKWKVESEDDNFGVDDLVASDEDFLVDEDGAKPKGKGRHQILKAPKVKAQDKPILARDERPKPPTALSSSAQSAPTTKRHIAETDPEKDKPPPSSIGAEPPNKRSKLPSVKKKPQITGAVASATGTPNARANTNSASVSVVPRGGTKPKASEVDLSNPDEYAKLFGITPSTVSKLVPKYSIIHLI